MTSLHGYPTVRWCEKVWLPARKIGHGLWVMIRGANKVVGALVTTRPEVRRSRSSRAAGDSRPYLVIIAGRPACFANGEMTQTVSMEFTQVAVKFGSRLAVLASTPSR